MLDKLTERLQQSFKALKGNTIITEPNISQTVKEIRKALLDADVHYNVAKEFTQKVKQQAIGRKVLQSVSPGQMMTKIVEEELALLMGSKQQELILKNKPAIIMMVGLQGVGKTTLTSKVAHLLQQQKGKKPLVVAADIYRPAAVDQLRVLCESIGVPLYSDLTKRVNPRDIVREAIAQAKREMNDLVLIDTAGRQTVNDKMMKELEDIAFYSKPDEILFVLDAMIGQDAVNTAKVFFDRLHYTGIVLTKMDGDARGGAALSATYITGVPIKLLSTGEKIEQLESFYPQRMAQRILGMGDVLTLVEKAQAQFDEKEAVKLEKKIRKAQFDFNDFKTQLQKIQQMGDIKNLISMIPGAAKKFKNVQVDEKNFVRIEAIINSMTPYERSHPDCFNQSRKQRIASGAGRSVTEVNALLQQFAQMKKMMKGKMTALPNMPFS